MQDIRDVFSPAKHKRHYSEQKHLPPSQPPNGVESPKINGVHIGGGQFNSASKPFEAAARLGLMGSQDLPALSSILSPVQQSNQQNHYSEQKYNKFAHSIDDLIEEIGTSGFAPVHQQPPMQVRYGQPTAMAQVPVGNMQ